MPTPTNLSKLTELTKALAELESSRNLMAVEEANIRGQLDVARKRHGDYSSAGRVVLNQSLQRLYTHAASYETICERLFELTAELQ